VVWQLPEQSNYPIILLHAYRRGEMMETPDNSAMILITKSYRCHRKILLHIFLDVIQACDKRAIEIPHFARGCCACCVCGGRFMTVADERACDEATAQSRYQSISVCGLSSLPHLLS
jgi:hypothetical protein